MKAPRSQTRPRRAKKLDWKRVGISLVTKLIVPGAVGLFFSQNIQGLTASILWFPADLRIGILSAFVGVVTSLAVGTVCKRVVPIKGASKQIYHHLFSLFLIVLAVLCFYQALKLRGDSVHQINVPREWWQRQFGWGQSTAETNQVTQARLPDFVNFERSSIFLPPEFDHEMESYLKQLGEGKLRAGIRVALDMEPMRLIDWAESSGAAIRAEYIKWILIWHFGFICSITAAWGLFRGQTELAFENWIEKTFS